jgi:hypothetical protein
MFIGIDRGMMFEGEMLEDGGMECGGDGIAPEGRKESESRLDISSVVVEGSLVRCLYYCRAGIEVEFCVAVRL